MIPLVRSFILYYLNVKPTHGYEIQKFLQISGVDSWTKIQSGSIYYALSKLEKEGCVEVLKEEKTGARVRKIYQITEAGKQELQQSIKNELKIPIVPAGSDKFLLTSILDALPKEVIEANLESHLKTLKEQKKYWEEWKEKKCSDEESKKADKIAFDMTVDSLKYQILWHEEILKNIDEYSSIPKKVSKDQSYHNCSAFCIDTCRGSCTKHRFRNGLPGLAKMFRMHSTTY